jgi:hypothetical protein
MQKDSKLATEPEWKQDLAELNPDALFANGFEDAYIGFIENRWVGEDSAPIAVYSSSKCIEVLMRRDGMTYDEAAEFFEFNVSGAYVGPNTPMFLVDRPEECVDGKN